jgi:pyridoxamine 5'-phosphate oxidase family protein
MTSRIILTDTERAYVQSQPLGRLATVDANGAPQNNPVGVFLDEETGDIVIGGGSDGRVPEVPQRSGQPPGRPGH